MHHIFSLVKSFSNGQVYGTLFQAFLTVAFPIYAVVFIVKIVFAVLCWFGLNEIWLNFYDCLFLHCFILGRVISCLFGWRWWAPTKIVFSVYGNQAFPIFRASSVFRTKNPKFTTDPMYQKAVVLLVRSVFNLNYVNSLQNYCVCCGFSVIQMVSTSISEIKRVRSNDQRIFSKLSVVSIVIKKSFFFQSFGLSFFFPIDVSQLMIFTFRIITLYWWEMTLNSWSF